MTRRTDADWAADIVAAVAAIYSHQASHRALPDAARSSAEPMYVDALTYRLMSVGEACKNLSPEARAFGPDVPWSDIVGLRDFLAHHYHRRDPSIVVATVEHDEDLGTLLSAAAVIAGIPPELLPVPPTP
ncbi:DUF86 domain-containing protein [Cellulosimicrobium cellulans]|uniref:HepT-like ribonuclease domain-containing protein n=1 Tax=Cellulosimicrobium cellulans TaxID=1710 RepID=UPI002405E1D8|nr:HepT-like ribonuclease domain-containing protein [Cellulosimicrobium cellulans]MDF9878307.1 uncharacterized protein with HEPN domain [Cellulosimicrobium cellulans]